MGQPLNKRLINKLIKENRSIKWFYKEYFSTTLLTYIDFCNTLNDNNFNNNYRSIKIRINRNINKYLKE